MMMNTLVMMIKIIYGTTSYWTSTEVMMMMLQMMMKTLSLMISIMIKIIYGILQRLHWIDFVRTDGNCGYKAKEEVKIFINNIINVITSMCSFNTNIIIIIITNINIVMNGQMKKWISFEAPLTDSSNLPNCLR